MLKKTNTIIYTDKVKDEKGILLFSDIHYTGIKDNNKLNKLYNIIKKYKFDYICIPGDIIENIRLNDNNYLKNYIEKLSLLSPVIISLGNHDFEEKFNNKKIYYCNKKYLEEICKLDNVYLLDNNGITIDDIYFYGLTLNNKYYINESKEIFMKCTNNINNISNTKYNVLLVHSPIRINDTEVNEKISNYDLVLSGHMHNGMVPVIIDEIFNNNTDLVAPNKSLFPKYARGIIQNKNNITIVSSSVTKLTRILPLYIRIFNIFYPIGINYIKIKKGSNKYKSSYEYIK